MRILKLTILSGSLVAAASVAAIFAIYAAQLHNSKVPSPPPSSGVLWPASSYSASDCQQYNMSSIAFMKAIRMIIWNGDLSDVAFTEKTLGTNFSSRYFKGWDGKLDPKRLIYQTDQVLGGPIDMILDVPTSKSERLKYPWTGIMTIDGSDFPGPDTPGQPGDFIADCVHVSVSDFSFYFGNEFGYWHSSTITDPLSAGIGFEAAPFLEGSDLGRQKQGSPGKNGSKLYLSFSWDKESGLVYGIEIYQSP